MKNTPAYRHAYNDTKLVSTFFTESHLNQLTLLNIITQKMNFMVLTKGPS
jgi:hypothetical protein